MRPIFTIHAGEYLVASYIEDRLKNFRVWVPSKDEGVDLLITNKSRTKTIGAQVKFSKDFLPGDPRLILRQNLKACGWWALNRSKIKKSVADLWIFILPSFETKSNSFIIINPKVLLRLLNRFHPSGKIIQCYFWVTKKNQCWEARGLSRQDQMLIAANSYKNNARNFTDHLNNWDLLKKTMR